MEVKAMFGTGFDMIGGEYYTTTARRPHILVYKGSGHFDVYTTGGEKKYRSITLASAPDDVIDEVKDAQTRLLFFIAGGIDY